MGCARSSQKRCRSNGLRDDPNRARCVKAQVACYPYSCRRPTSPLQLLPSCQRRPRRSCSRRSPGARCFRSQLVEPGRQQRAGRSGLLVFIAWIGATRGLHPDFGPPPYGIPYVGVGGDQPRLPVTFTAYGSESDSGIPGLAGYPIPEEAKTQPNFIEGGVPGGGTAAIATCSSSIAIAGCSTSCSRRAGTPARTLGSRVRRDLRSERATPGAGRLDVGGRRGAGDSSRASCATTKSSAAARSARVPRPRARRTATCGRPRIAPARRRRAADGRASAAEGVERHLRLPPEMQRIFRAMQATG